MPMPHATYHPETRTLTLQYGRLTYHVGMPELRGVTIADLATLDPEKRQRDRWCLDAVALVTTIRQMYVKEHVINPVNENINRINVMNG